jgi:hypothetical protein
MNFNEWNQFVAFGSECDRTQFENFIKSYENAKFIQPRTRERKETNENRGNLPIISFRLNVANYFNFLFGNK